MGDSASFKVACNRCGGHVECTDEYDGTTTPCPHCGANLFISRTPQPFIPQAKPHSSSEKPTGFKRFFAGVFGWIKNLWRWVDDKTTVYPPFESKPKHKSLPPTASPTKPKAATKTTTPDQTGSAFFGGLMALGFIALLGGIACVVYFFQYYNALVADKETGEAVYNIGRLNERECGIIVGVGLSVVGAVITGVGLAITALLGLASGMKEFFVQLAIEVAKNFIHKQQDEQKQEKETG